MNVSKTSRAAGHEDHFDLLPFVALMMIVLAVLLFITMAIAALNMGAGAGEGWIPTSTSNTDNKVPILVEWDGETAIIQKSSGMQRIVLGKEVRKWWNADWKFGNNEMRSFLGEMIARKDSHYVLFAVRPSGFDNFQTLASEFRENGVSIGYEPVEQDRRIQLKIKEKGTP